VKITQKNNQIQLNRKKFEFQLLNKKMNANSSPDQEK
jgi:hypothetical protein